MAKVHATFNHSLTYDIRHDLPEYAACLSCNRTFGISYLGTDRVGTLVNTSAPSTPIIECDADVPGY